MPVIRRCRSFYISLFGASKEGIPTLPVAKRLLTEACRCV
jgi:hypothetical protein